MRWTVWLFGREVFSTELTRVAAPAEDEAVEYVSNVDAVLEVADGDDDGAYSPGYGDEEWTEYRMGFYPYA